MNSFSHLQSKLDQFVNKYYTNELIKGAILFFTIGALYFIFTLLVEHFFWLNTNFRTLLFWLFIIVEFFLLYRFIAVPLAYLFNIKKGLSFSDASKIIGKHFPEVSDKLLNVLQLKNVSNSSDLLLASIEQKSSELQPIPFKNAVNFKTNFTYLKYALIPVLIFLFFWSFGKLNWFSDSYTRVVNYDLAYEPPAPFKFFVLNTNLQAIENKPFTLNIETIGSVIPENVSILYNNESYFLERNDNGNLSYSFPQIINPITFRLLGNSVMSKPYTISLINAPQVVSFDMVLDYPKYTGKVSETLKSIGNAIVPEGTNITWKVNTKHTNSLDFFAADSLSFNKIDTTLFKLSKRMYSSLDYTLSSSNKNLKNYENLAFSLKVVKDMYPELDVQVKTDSLDLQTLYFYGKASDDYGLKNLKLFYFPINEKDNIRSKSIPISSSNYTEFITSFPSNLSIEEGKTYELYFEIFDNAYTSKSTKSTTFTYRKRTDLEETDKQLLDQNKSIEALGKSIKQFNTDEKELENLSKTQKEKSELNYTDQKKLNQFLDRQQFQKKELKELNSILQKNLDDFKKQNIKDNKNDAFKDDLMKRLKDNEAELKKDEKLLEELRKLQEKFSKEEFSEKLDELSKKAKSQKRSLEQILEMTKRYYVKKKLEQLSSKLDNLAKRQDSLSKNNTDNTKLEQDKLNEEFDGIKKELDEVDRDNKNLKSPLDMNRNKNTEENISNDQQQASDALQENEQSSNKDKKASAKSLAKSKQKNAAAQMKKLSMSMQMDMKASNKEQLEEDREMLRQILDNLLEFSFKEEDNMLQFKNIKTNNSSYTKHLKTQNELKNNFEHIDDSLFALSTRQPMISEKVNTEIENIYYSIDKALERFADNNIFQGVGFQQYAVTSTNVLADLLSDALESIDNQMGMPSPGSGDGGMPLPDIIISQDELAKKMEQGQNKGDKGKDGKDGKNGEDGNKGETGKSGSGSQDGKNGSSGKNGTNSSMDSNNTNGKNRKSGSLGSNSNQSGSGLSEDEKLNEALNGELFKIYQEQQKLREALDKRLEKDGLKSRPDSKSLLQDMERLELDMLNKGFTKETASKMKTISHKLLQLENAVLQQGEDTRRKSESNFKQFNESINSSIDKAKSYFNTTEILNKQNLPLQPIYKAKVQQYFKLTND